MDKHWDEFYTTNDVNIKWQIFENIIESHVDKFCPLKQIRIRSDSPQWFTKELIQEIFHRDRLYIKAKSTNDKNDWIFFRHKKNEVKKLINQAREEFVKVELEQDKNDPKKFWRSINTLTGLGKGKSKKSLSEIITDDGVSLKGSGAANYMNEYYTNAGPNLASKFSDSWSPDDCKIDGDHHFSFGFITEQVVSKLVSEIKISKSSAMGSLSSRILKDVFEIRAAELTELFNTCLDTGVFPHSWGIGEITPIPKANVHSKIPGEWRPITQIKLPGKLLERCVHCQLYRYFEELFLAPQQHSFRPEKDTSTAVFDMLKESFNYWNEKLYQTCVFIDFSRAFDCIDHNILISKLKLYGLDSKAVSFISSYFNNRYQCTKVDGHVSSLSKVTYGTAQGSILGPLIFIIYVNDLFYQINDKKNIIMYADDTLLMSKSSDLEESVSECQCLLDKIVTWCAKNKLTMNIKKTKCMYINAPGCTPSTVLSVNNKPLDVVKSFEYLGMHVDDKLQMNKHVESIYKKARSKLGILYKICRFITSQTCLLLYKVMIRPHMEYGDFVIDSAGQGLVTRLDNLQNKALRLVEYKSNAMKMDMSKLQSSLKIENLETRRKRGLLRLMFTQSKITSNVQIDKKHMKLRSSCKIKMKSKFTKLTKIQRSPYYRGLKLWDQLPENVQKEPNRKVFELKLLDCVKS